MNTINILIVVDTVGASTSGSLQDNVYIADTNGYLGSWNEGTSRLHTIIQNGQEIKWACTGISPSNDVEINSFSGQMVIDKICTPSKQGLPQATVWQGEVQTLGDIGPWSYTVTMTIDGAPMTFNATLKVL